METGYGIDDRGSIPSGDCVFSFSTSYPDWLWGPPSLLSNGYWGLSPWGQSGQCVNLTIHLHLVPRSKNACSYTSPPQNIFMAWCLVQHRDKFIFTLYILYPYSEHDGYRHSRF